MKFLQEHLNLNAELLGILRDKGVNLGQLRDYQYHLEDAANLNLDYSTIKNLLRTASTPDEFSAGIFELTGEKRYDDYYAKKHVVNETLESINAIAYISGNTNYKDISGKITFTNYDDEIKVTVNLWNLPQSMYLGFHIHDIGKCENNFKSAEGHYNPDNKNHPKHRGDLPLLYTSNGKVKSTFLVNTFTIDEIIGKSVIIHAQADDYKSQPAGDSGNRIACGVIEKFEDGMKFINYDEDIWDEEERTVLPKTDITESKNPLRRMQKFARKRQKGLPALSALNPNAGNVEKGIEMFNAATDIGSTGLAESKEKQINIRKALNKYDAKDYKDLVNMYDSLILSKTEKEYLLTLIQKDDIKAIYNFLNSIYKKEIKD